MARLKPWYNLIDPREDLRENHPLDAAEFAVHLDHIREGRAADDYVKPDRFFERTLLTEGLLDLASQTVRRLSGVQVETSAVFNMATQFGGGKTHSLTTLFHLANQGDAAKGWRGVESILQKADVAAIPKADTAVFVGTEFDVLDGRGAAGEPKRLTPWGEIAYQLGGDKSFAAVKEHDSQKIAPAGDVIRKMLPDGPVLVLMDELLNYVSRGRKLGLRDELFNFIQNLAEEARARNNMVLCVSIPSSEIEMNPDDQRDHDSLKKLLDRIGKAVLMSANREMAEIIRRRLFEWWGLPDEAKKTCRQYAEWYGDHAQELTGIDTDGAYESFCSCWPFHPSVISVFERKWQSLPKFQRTRGILRLLALWVARASQEEYQKRNKEPLINLGLAPLDDPLFRAAVFEQLGSAELEVPVTMDIIGKSDAHAVRLDKEATTAIKRDQLHRKVATTVFFESNGGQSQAKAVASLPEIRTATGGPDVNLADMDTVLEGLASTCYYLNWDRNTYRFGLTPNLNQVLMSRRGAVDDNRVDERINKETEKLFQSKNRTFDPRFPIERSNDVPNRPVLTIPILGLDLPAEEKATSKFIGQVVSECGASGRTFKSALVFAAPDGASTIREAIRNLLAWEDIAEDEDTRSRIDASQKQVLDRNLSNARREVKENMWRTYRHLYLLGPDNKLRHIDLGQITSSAATDYQELIHRELSRNDEVTDGVSPNKLTKYWPPAITEWSTKSVRDAFFSSPKLPRLVDGDAIKRTIADGVSQGILGYAVKDDRGKTKLQSFESSMADNEVEISDDVFILRAEDAKKLLEPPKLATLQLRPESATVAIGEKVSFSCFGKDQYDQQLNIAEVNWTAKGGMIAEDGVFTANDAGLFTVHASSDSTEAIAEVRVVEKPAPAEAGSEAPPAPVGKRLVHWQGQVPPQKWMNFYTKVLSKLASSSDLTLTVKFEVPLDQDEAESRREDSRSGLKELELDDDVQLR